MKNLTCILLFILGFAMQLHAEVYAWASFDERMTSYLHKSGSGTTQIGRIVINDRTGGITQSTWLYVNAALSYYKKAKPTCIVLELNTPGGEVFSAQKISDALKDFDTQMGIPVIAYINNWAISAGALLAYSCRFIVVAKDASMGAAEPVLLSTGAEGMKEAPEKINSALRADFANRARFFDRNPYIAEAMVDKDIILVERQGQIIKLSSEDDIIKNGPDPDIIISPEGKLLTLTAEELIKYSVADQLLLPLQTEPITEAEDGKGVYSLAKSQLIEIKPLASLMPCDIHTFEMDWQTRFLAFLSTPAISSILFLAMMVGFYIEISSSTFGVAGVIATTSLFFILLSSYALEAIYWLEPLLLFFGIGLLMLEIFVFPTLGLLGFLGTLFMIIGLVAMMLPGLESVHFSGSSVNAAGDYVLSRLSWLSVSFLVGCVIIVALSRYMMPRIRLMQRIVLQDTPLLATGEHDMKMHEPVAAEKPKIGDIAIVAAPLRPAGKIMINDVEIDALSVGGYIEKGQKVKILQIEGAKIIVESELI